MKTKKQIAKIIDWDVRAGDDVECTAFDLIKLIISHANDSNEGNNYILKPKFANIRETTNLSMPQCEMFVAISRKVTLLIANEILN